MQKWTQTEAVDFECAREVITDLQAILSGLIYDESSKEHPDAERLATLEAERSRLFHERAGLHVKDHDAVARVRAEYGARVRAWRADRQAVAVQCMAQNPDEHRLSEAEHQAIFERDIKPDLFAGVKPSGQPLAVIFGGQPGAGKSAAVDEAMNELASRGGAVQIIGDDLRDVQASRAAGMPVIAAAYGYCSGQDVNTWQADHTVAHPSTLHEAINALLLTLPPVELSRSRAN